MTTSTKTTKTTKTVSVSTFRRLLKEIKGGKSALNQAAQAAAVQAVNGNKDWLTQLTDSTRTPSGRVGAEIKEWAKYVTAYTTGLAIDPKTGEWSYTAKTRTLKEGGFPETLAEFTAKVENHKAKKAAEEAAKEAAAPTEEAAKEAAAPAPAPAAGKDQRASAKQLTASIEKMREKLSHGVKGDVSEIKALIEQAHALWGDIKGAAQAIPQLDVNLALAEMAAAAPASAAEKRASK